MCTHLLILFHDDSTKVADLCPLHNRSLGGRLNVVLVLCDDPLEGVVGLVHPTDLPNKYHRVTRTETSLTNNNREIRNFIGHTLNVIHTLQVQGEDNYIACNC